jgi:hypothetical protein
MKPIKAKRFAPDLENQNISYFRLTDDRYVKVFERHNKIRIDIRKYYLDDGLLKPSKNGIQLSQKSWKQLMILRKTIKKLIKDIEV